MQTVIETKDLCKAYGKRLAVDHIQLHVPQGCVYGFIGPNGAGKSTTMKMLLGLIHPSAGQVFLLGREKKKKNRLALLRQTGSLIESPSGYLHLTAQEAQTLLKQAGYRELYPRDPRDALLLFAFSKHMTILEANVLLFDHDIEVLE